MYFDPLSPDNELEINKLFKSFVNADPNDPPIKDRKLTAWGRTILVPESTSTVAKFTFNDLCGQPLSAADYLEVTRNFGTVFLLQVPKMDLNKKDMVCVFRGLVGIILSRYSCRRGDLSLSLTVSLNGCDFSLWAHRKSGAACYDSKVRNICLTAVNLSHHSIDQTICHFRSSNFPDIRRRSYF